MSHSPVKQYVTQGRRRIISYLSTWRELLLRPFAFIALTEEGRLRYTKIPEFVTWTFLLGAALTYVGLWVIADPLAPPRVISVGSTTMMYVSLGVFLGLWLLFGVFVVRLFRRETQPLPLKRIFTALVYLLVGTSAAVQVLIGLIAWVFVRIFLSSAVLAFTQEHSSFLIACLILLSVFALTPAFFTAWLLTKALRHFYPVGKWRGIVIPATCWLLILGSVFYLQKYTTPEHFSTKEQEALRRLYVLSDLESVSMCRDGTWEDDFNKLKSIMPGYHECGEWNPFLIGEATIAKSYTQEMEGYRFTIQLHHGGDGCILWALPMDYQQEGTKLSFGKRCALNVNVETETIAEDVFGGRPNVLFGRSVSVQPGWKMSK